MDKDQRMRNTLAARIKELEEEVERLKKENAKLTRVIDKLLEGD